MLDGLETVSADQAKIDKNFLLAKLCSDNQECIQNTVMKVEDLNYEILETLHTNYCFVKQKKFF